MDKLYRFASILLKRAQILAPGQSTTTVQEAVSIGKRALAALEEIDPDVLASYEHTNFKEAMTQLSEGTVPEGNLLQAAVREFNGGLKNFANMISIPVQKILFIMKY